MAMVLTRKTNNSRYDLNGSVVAVQDRPFETETTRGKAVVHDLGNGAYSTEGGWALNEPKPGVGTGSAKKPQKEYRWDDRNRLEYTPYGELWIEKASAASALDVAYRFTGKERDKETGLYYYGARYLDPRDSRWLSVDPALGEYIPEAPVNEEAKKRNGNLPGMGGVFNYVNLHVYHYAGNNPVKYIDPDGRTGDNPSENSTTETSTSVSTSINSVNGEVRNGPFKAEGTASVGYVEGMIRFQANKKEGSQKGMIGMFGKASVANVSMKAGVGNDNVSVSLKGVGDIGTTTAQAGVQYKGGFGLAVEGRASVASGRATVEFEVLGFQVEVGVSGHVLSVSGSVMIGYFPSEGFKLKIGASLGAGADVLLRIKRE
jgi:RHS repeat-associated protein